jgi:thioredoxin 1
MRYSSSFAVFAALAAVPAAIVAAPAAAQAAPTVQPYNQAAFDAAQRAGKPILVWVHAPWCPVCRAQARTIASVTAAPAYRDMVVFRIDFDSQRPLWQRFGATQQSTLIAFRGARETRRIAHETDEGKVSAVIRSAIS